ncbi:MAG: ABC transporter permease [Coriobacteriaceae bacterium]|nr:ABC transporter permease [Coriobacteriaceae bacterium]
MKRTNRNNLKKAVLNSVLPVLLALIIGAIIIACIGEDPLATYALLFEKSLLTPKGFMNTLHYAMPLVLTGLAIAVTFKANIYNMAVEGSCVLGGFFAGIVGASLSAQMDVLSMQVICLLTGILFGVLFALLPAVLKAVFHVDEMVVTLMLNYALQKILEYLATGVFRDTASGYVCTPTIHTNAMFNRMGNFRITPFVFIALVAFIIIYLIMKHSKLGYEITAMGKSATFSEAMGMRTTRKIIILMIISGALSGLAGAGWMMSEKFKYTLDFSGNPGLGWDGMLVSLLGGHSPIGILVAAILYAALKTGADSINIYSTVPKEIVSVIQGLIILFLAIKFVDERFGVSGKISQAIHTYKARRKKTTSDQISVQEEV